jgi:O-antigen/teichoic acid export membrane protein
MPNTKKAIKSLSFLWMGSLLGSGSTFVIYMILARELGIEQFGLFSSSLATIIIFSLISGFGVSQSWLKHFGQEGWGAIRWVKPSLKLIFVSAIFVLMLLFLWVHYGPVDPITKNILLIMSVFLISQMIIELVSVKLQLEEKYAILALWQLLPNLLRLIVIVLFTLLSSTMLNVLDVSIIYASIGIIFILIGIYQLYNINNNLQLKGHKHTDNINTNSPKIKDVLSHSWAFGLAGIFAFVYLQSDIIMIKYISGNKAAGLYNIAFVVITAILIFPTVLYQKFLMPKLHRWAIQDESKFYLVYKKGNIAMFVSGIVIMILLLLSSGFLISLLFGDSYVGSILVLNILSITLPIYFVAYSVGATLVTRNNMKIKVKFMGVTAITNIVLNLILIPLYGSIGAAIATVISNIMLLLLYYGYAEQVVFKNRIKKENKCGNI